MSTILDKDLEAILNKTLEEYDALVSNHKARANLDALIKHFAKSFEGKREQELARSKSKNTSGESKGQKEIQAKETQAGESKEQKEKQDFVYVLGNTISQPNILVNDKLPSEGGVPKQKDSRQFAKERGFEAWMDNIITERSRWAEFKRMIDSKIRKDKEKKLYHRFKGLTSDILKKMTFEASQKIQLVDMGGKMNMAAFSAKKIRRGEMLFYGGELKFEPKMRFDEETEYNVDLFSVGKGLLAIDGFKYRNMASFLAHLPDKEYVDENYVFKDKTMKDQVATANFDPKMVWIEDLNMFVLY